MKKEGTAFYLGPKGVKKEGTALYLGPKRVKKKKGRPYTWAPKE